MGVCCAGEPVAWRCFSALQRAEIAEMPQHAARARPSRDVSVLFNEPKLLKSLAAAAALWLPLCFSALQRAEIAEIELVRCVSRSAPCCFSALQRAEIAEI